MTLEELKIEANKLGYNLIKKNPKPKILPCICGCRRRRHLYIGSDNIYNRALVCKRCGRRVEGIDDRDVINNWNKEIESEVN